MADTDDNNEAIKQWLTQQINNREQDDVPICIVIQMEEEEESSNSSIEDHNTSENRS
ncbi:hypothetical protein ACFLYP_00215 [Chloroflexota bacterium]